MPSIFHIYVSIHGTMENTHFSKKGKKLIEIVYWLFFSVISVFLHKFILKIMKGPAAWLQKSYYHIILEICS